ncbi:MULTISPECIES: hypothetical protein [unclassified Inquilinus]|uniref:hypothetical protein n=1 Tax=unclassified Inquilinus TaxID=2645927 RepID=UPI003F8DF8C9
MSTWTRLALAASLTVATVPAATAQCIVDPNIIGSPCIGGSPPFVNQSREFIPFSRPASPAISTPAPRQTQSLRAPTMPPLRMPSHGRL